MRPRCTTQRDRAQAEMKPLRYTNNNLLVRFVSVRGRWRKVLRPENWTTKLSWNGFDILSLPLMPKVAFGRKISLIVKAKYSHTKRTVHHLISCQGLQRWTKNLFWIPEWDIARREKRKKCLSFFIHLKFQVLVAKQAKVLLLNRRHNWQVLRSLPERAIS